jgi:hypothetical protein
VTDQTETSSSEGGPGGQAPQPNPIGSSDQQPYAAEPAAPKPSLPQRAAELVDERPEVVAGAGFAGGFVLAMILRRLAH